MAEKACNSLLRLAVANERRKAVFMVKCLRKDVSIFSKGAFMRYLRTTRRSQRGISRCASGRSTVKLLTED